MDPMHPRMAILSGFSTCTSAALEDAEAATEPASSEYMDMKSVLLMLISVLVLRVSSASPTEPRRDCCSRKRYRSDTYT